MKGRILVVEDEPEIRDLIVFTLQRHGFEAAGVEYGEEAWIDAPQGSDVRIAGKVSICTQPLCTLFHTIPR